MKKIVIVFTLSFLILSNTFAQFGGLQKKFITVGVRGGLNFSKLTTQGFQVSKLGSSVKDFFDNNSTNKAGYVFGAYLRAGKTFFIQPEVLISSKGGTFSILQNGNTPINIDVKFSQIDVPVLIGYKFGPLRVNAGPMASLNVGSNSSLSDALKQYTTQNVSNTINQATFGYQAGVGLDIGSFNLDVRYECGFSNISNLNLQNNAQFNTKASLWQLTLGLVLL